MAVPTTGEHETVPSNSIAAFEHITGPERGRSLWLNKSEVEVVLNARRQLRVRTDLELAETDTSIARITCRKGTYEISAIDAWPIWINGALASTSTIKNRDIIEFGDVGPLSRFRIHNEEMAEAKTLGELLGDVFSYLKVSRQPFIRRLYRATVSFGKRIAQETTLLFRLGVVASLGVLAALTVHQARVNMELQQQIRVGADQLEGFTRALARARAEALNPGDLKGLRDELENKLTLSERRLGELEKRTDATSRVIAEARSSVFFLQGAYAFRELSSQRYLRHMVDSAGKTILSPFGQPRLTLEGEGPVAERQFTGTGFALRQEGTLITNRHVALPWENDATVSAMTDQGFEPVMIKQVAYVNGTPEAYAVELVAASDEADLALLRLVGATNLPVGLQLADKTPAAGAEVILMGFPTGLRSMLAQSGKEFVEELQKSKDTNFWNVALKLAEKGYIAPLSSRGIVSQTTRDTIVYDADTTHGGSGGPVLDIEGRVVAVNAAILPEYGGSNLGVPVSYVKNLLAKTPED